MNRSENNHTEFYNTEEQLRAEVIKSSNAILRTQPRTLNNLDEIARQNMVSAQKKGQFEIPSTLQF